MILLKCHIERLDYIYERGLLRCHLTEKGNARSLRKQDGNRYRFLRFIIDKLFANEGNPAARVYIVMNSGFFSKPRIPARYASVGITLLFSLGASAFDFEEGGLYFNIIGKNVVELTSGETYYEGDVTVPGEIIHAGTTYNVLSIGERAFAECRELQNVTLLEGIEQIGDIAFGWCSSMGSLTLPTTIKEIGSEVFHACSNNGIYISDLESFCKINTHCSIFYRNTSDDALLYLNGEMVRALNFPENLTEVPNFIFGGCKSIETVSFPDKVESIGWGSFSSCENLKTITLSSSLKTIKGYAFSSCKSLEEITFPQQLAEIGSDAFSGCTNLKKVNWNGNIKIIPNMCFYNCGFETINLPDGVESIEQLSFANCRNLKKISLPSSITAIGERAFDEDPALEGVYLYSVVPPTFYPQESNITFYVPNGAIYNYELENWQRFFTLSEFDAGIQTYPVYFDFDSDQVRVFMGRVFDVETNYYISSNENILEFRVQPKSNIVIDYIDASCGTISSENDSGIYYCSLSSNSETSITIGSSVKRNNLSILYPDIMQSSISIPSGIEYSITFTTMEGWSINNISLNDQLIENEFEGTKSVNIPPLHEDAVISVVLKEKKEEDTGIEDTESEKTNLNIYYQGGKILIDSNKINLVEVYDVNGHAVYKGETNEIPVNSGVYIIKTEGNTYKLLAK